MPRGFRRRNLIKKNGGPRNWVFSKKPMQYPMKQRDLVQNGYVWPGNVQRISIFAVIPSTWRSIYVRKDVSVFETIATSTVGPSYYKPFNMELMSKPGQDVLTVFHGRSHAATIALRRNKWFMVVALRPIRAKTISGIGLDRVVSMEPTGRNKVALVPIPRPKGWTKFLALLK